MKIELDIPETCDLIAFAMKAKHGITVDSATIEESNKYGSFRGFLMEVPATNVAVEIDIDSTPQD